jgi:hypothetical protein
VETVAVSTISTIGSEKAPCLRTRGFFVSPADAAPFTAGHLMDIFIY